MPILFFHHPSAPVAINPNTAITDGVLHAPAYFSANAVQLRPFRAHLLDVVLGQGLRRAVHGLLLHVLRHVGVLDHCLPLLRHALLDFLWPLAVALSFVFVSARLLGSFELKTGLKLQNTWHCVTENERMIGSCFW